MQRRVDELILHSLPVICLDICSILDLARNPKRPKITLEAQQASRSLLELVERQELHSVISVTENQEHARNLDQLEDSGPFIGT